MLTYFTTLFVLSVTSAFYRWPFWLLSCLWFITPFVFYKLKFITNTQGIITLFLMLNIMALINIRPIRRWLVTIPILQIFNNKDSNSWAKFKRIDSGWLATDFEKKLFNGQPDFKVHFQDNKINTAGIQKLIKTFKKQWPLENKSFAEQLKELHWQGLMLPTTYGGYGLNVGQLSAFIQHVAEHEPLLGAALGILNCESVITLINQHGSNEQKKHWLPAFASGKKQAFLTPTFLYELLENNQSSIEGRIDLITENGQTTPGIRLSFDDVILLGTQESNIFYLAIRVTDFTNELSNKTQLGTALCLFDVDNDRIKIKKGNATFKGLLQYFQLRGDNIFIPLTQIIGGFGSVNQGIKQLYQLQAFAAGLWPAAVSLPVHKNATLISWYFAHIKKQNSRALLDYKLVKKQLNQLFSHSYRLQLLNKMSMANEGHTLSYSHILFKNTILDTSMNQLNWLRTILGSHAHNIKSQNNLNQYFRIKHLSMELDGDSYQINQLPLMKKVALSAHPYYAQEIELMASKEINHKALDRLLFKHGGLICHQLAKVWVHAIRTSWLGRWFWKKSKYQNFVKRMTASYALIADIALLKWSIKSQSNTEFTGFLANCNQQLVLLMGLISEHTQNNNDAKTNFLLKLSLKDCFYLTQKSLNQTINSAFSRFTALILKIIIFPFGKPFHRASFSSEFSGNLATDEELIGQEHSMLHQIAKASQQLREVQATETAVKNATGMALTTKNHQVLINRTLAAGIISVEQAERLRSAYSAILDIQLINHFGNHNENQKN